MTPMQRGRVLYLSLPLLLFGWVAYPFLSGHGVVSRHLECDKHDGRAQTICRRLEREMQWTWTGHAIASPGWRVTFESVARTYCLEHVGPEDIPSLQALQKTTKDWRVETGADFLLRLIRGKDEGITSIFNSANPSFLLKDGCQNGG